MSAISDAEQRRHIADCHLLMQLAQARFRGSHALKDAQEFSHWLGEWHDAIHARHEAAIERQAAAARDELTVGGEWTDSIGRLDVPAAAVRRRTGRAPG